MQKPFLKLFALLLAAALLLPLAACNKKDDAATNGQITLTWWRFMNNDLVQPLIDKYEAENPGVKIESQQLDWSNGLNKLQMSVASGNQPDLAEFGSTDLAGFAETGHLLDITRGVADIRDSFTMWEPAEMGGKTYGLPWLVGPRALFYNKTLLEEAGVSPEMMPPTTWAQLLSAARQTNDEAKGVYGFGMNAGEANIIYKKFMPFAWGIGGRIIGPDGKAAFNSPEVNEALEFYLRLKPYSLQEKQSLIDAKFIEGKVALWISGGWLITKIAAGAPDLNYGVALVPKHSMARGEPTSFGGAEMLAVFKKSAHPDEALSFAKFLIAAENALPICEANATFLPAQKDLSALPFFQDDPRRRALAEQMQFTRHTPNHPKWKPIEKEVDDAIEKAQLGEATPAEALAEANAAIEKILNEK